MSTSRMISEGKYWWEAGGGGGGGGGGCAEFDQIAVLVLDIQKDRLS